MISPCTELENGANREPDQAKLFKMLKSKSAKGEPGDQRTMDAADTLVSLAHSASSTPTVEFKPFRPADDEVIEKTIKLEGMSGEATSSNNSLVESACKILIEQVLKSCPTVNLSSITIKASTKRADSPEAKRSRADTETDSDGDEARTRPAPTLATGRRSRDLELPPDEARKRQDRRERNKLAAARCRRRREQLADSLSLKTDDLSKEQEELRKNYQELVKEKLKWKKIYDEHVKECEKKGCSAMALTPISAGLAHKENFLGFLEQSDKTKTAGLTRPNNLDLKNTTSTTTTMVTPTSASINSMLQGIAYAFGQSTTPGSFSIGSNNNISFVMTPTFQMNTPTAFLSLAPIESQLATLNTPMLVQSNQLLALQEPATESKNATNSLVKS